jgi:hypothetical protein
MILKLRFQRPLSVPARVLIAMLRTVDKVNTLLLLIGYILAVTSPWVLFALWFIVTVGIENKVGKLFSFVALGYTASLFFGWWARKLRDIASWFWEEKQ